MSTEVTIPDESALMGAIADVRSDVSDINFLICGHVDRNPNVIELKATGLDTSEISSHMLETEALYCLARYESVVDMSTVVKFVYVHWMGEKVPMIEKGRLGVIHGSVMDKFNPHHLFIETNSTEDLEKEKVIEGLKESMGTMNKVLENTDITSRQMRGFTQSQLPQKNNRPAFMVSAVASKGLAMEVQADVYDAVSKVRNDDDPEMWVVAGYQDGNPKAPVVMVAQGNGDLSEVQECFDESQAMYALYRVSHVTQDEIQTVKFVYITWVGSRVKPMTKAKISTHKGSAEEIFAPFHVKINATEPSDISEKDIMQMIKHHAS